MSDAGNGNDAFVAHLVTAGTLKTARVIDAFRRVDRAAFVPDALRAYAYDDRPLPLPAGATISQPSVVALMLEWLQPREGDRVLDVGSGSGWTTALLAAIVGPHGFVTGIELEPELVTSGGANLSRAGVTNASIQHAAAGLGVPGRRFNRILVSAAAATEIPPDLIDQLDVDGVMVIPVDMAICVVRKSAEGAITIERHDGFAFVPLR